MINMEITEFPSKARICSQTLQNYCFWDGDFDGTLQNYENRIFRHKTPCHQDLLPGLAEMYVSGKVI